MKIKHNNSLEILKKKVKEQFKLIELETNYYNLQKIKVFQEKCINLENSCLDLKTINAKNIEIQELRNININYKIKILLNEN